jgi:hypothetical protein
MNELLDDLEHNKRPVEYDFWTVYFFYFFVTIFVRTSYILLVYEDLETTNTFEQLFIAPLMAIIILKIVVKHLYKNSIASYWSKTEGLFFYRFLVGIMLQFFLEFINPSLLELFQTIGIFWDLFMLLFDSFFLYWFYSKNLKH